ncbi:MAG: FAD-dependent oxidoreductase [Opitutaceae bacterium]|jgi:hypothetical protein|nr:FAD-dependent oxidoreductase [Opitutaceae bacterium]
MSIVQPHKTTHDIVIFGAGHTGFAAALACRRAGLDALLVDRRAALLGESGWSFASDNGSSAEPLWSEWRATLARHDGSSSDAADGAIAEVLATDLVLREAMPVLYHAAPCGAELDADGLVGAVIVATKSGTCRLRARRWIDATDAGELALLLARDWTRPLPQTRTVNLFFRHPRPWPLPAFDLPAPAALPAGSKLRWQPGKWAGEQILSIILPGDAARARSAWLPSLRSIREAAADELKGAVLTHGSVMPLNAFPPRAEAAAARIAKSLPENVCFAGADGVTLAQKFDAGCRAARIVAAFPCARAGADAALRPLSQRAVATRAADVGVAGLGTGGAIAAIAAARAGAKVFAFEQMPFPGGVGTGGGLHVYYFGVKGGLQEEVDARVREIMPLFGDAAQIGGFHPEAKKLVLDAMLAGAGVEVCQDASFHFAETHAGSVTGVRVATPGGPLHARAAAWVDATGDADLAAAAGAHFRLGRAGDGMTHAYGQSSGRAAVVGDAVKLHIINFDAGYCDATDVADITRARLASVRQYVQARYDAGSRPTYIAPVLGVRQSRQIETDYTLTLDDLIDRRSFPDAVGHTGCHYDNHARDYEFESVEAAFWVWVCQQWYGRLACEIPYGMLLPRGLKNVVLACRAAGVSEEAHHSFRMQRDVQRIGEAAGLACALTATAGLADCREAPFEQLRARLVKTGALGLPGLPERMSGGHADAACRGVTPAQIDLWLASLRGGPATGALWHLYRHEKLARPQITALAASPDDTVSWRAAAILAMWGDERAEPRLLRAIRTREDDRARDITRPQQEWFYMPRWYGALTILKRCITPASLPMLEGFAGDAHTPLNLRNAVALACEALASRQSPGDGERARMAALLARLLATPAPHAIRSPQGSPLGKTEPPSVPQPTDLQRVIEDYTWQLHYAVARAYRSLGLPPHNQAGAFLRDDRAIVRRAFERVLNRGSNAPRPAPEPAARPVV